MDEMKIEFIEIKGKWRFVVEQFPPSIATYRSGTFYALSDAAEALADWLKGWAAVRRAEEQA